MRCYSHTVGRAKNKKQKKLLAWGDGNQNLPYDVVCTIPHVGQIDHLDPELPLNDMLCRICAVQIQPRKHALL